MAPPKSKVDGEGKGKAVATTTPSTRVLRSMNRKTRSDTRRSGSSSKLVQLESPEKKKRKTKAKDGGAAATKLKKENEEEEEEEVTVKVEKEEEEHGEDDAAEEANEEDDSGKKKIVIEHCKQCKSFKERANQVKEGLEEAVPGIIVTVNPDKPRRGCLEIREEGGETFISLLGMKRPFTLMKELNMEEVIKDIVEKIK
ncbi:PREDICTED: selenoprotein H-like [Camelina sativa]|uniref:Selenoprotein H-like n=1 Tax=Camelina sativa TaxID=90675 RepID=A0ABM0WKN8_CAMSA|nr:PREDICTED: selenoprotein H-like [Camelina sativa]XP_010472455.1 PREDICTED: selenoprotein H-like [Camelina sativa]